MQRSKHRRSRQSRVKRAALACAIDVLESRQLFSGETLTTPIASVLANVTNPSANAITLDQNFTNANLPGTLVTFKTNLGTITVALTDAATPLTVANFLNYVKSGAYTDTIFHRTAVLSSANGSGGSPSAPADIIQGGGYVVSGNTFKHIATNAAVADEYTKEILNDSTGTLAMAKTSSANSATSEWYFNVHDNTNGLDTPTTDSNGVTTSYTVFGKVLTGMNVIDEIAALPTYNVSSTLGLTTVPVTGLTVGEVKKNFPVSASNLVYTDSVTSEPGTNYTVSSSNNALVTPKITNGVLSFTYASGLTGTAIITVDAKSLDGSSASTTFSVTVPNKASPTSGAVATSINAPNVVTGNSENINVLGSDSDSTAALNQSSVSIVTQPTHGTATVNTSTGTISYTPTAGYTGSDSLAYTVADTNSNVSNPATVTLNVVPKPTSITIGTANAKTLTFTEPSGVIGHLAITGGTAVVTFSGDRVTTTTTGGIVTATGADTTIAGIVITNTGAAASLSLSSNGAVNLGTVMDLGAVSILNAPNATLTGASSFQSINRLSVAAATDATLSLGSGNSTTLVIPNVTDTTVNDSGSIASITSAQWVNDNGGYYALTAARIGRLKVSGGFADVLNLTGSGSSLVTSSVGQANAAWTLAGTIGTATFGNPGSAFSLAASGNIGSLFFGGNLANSISAAGIGALTVTGTTTGATIATTSSQASRLKFGSDVGTSSISLGGALTSLTAGSITSTQITSATIGSFTVTGAATSATVKTTAASSNNVQVGRVRIGGVVNTSSFNTSGGIASFTASSLTSSQITGGTIGVVDVPGESNTATIRTTAAASNKVQINQLKLGATVSSSISTAGSIGRLTAASLDSTQVASATLGSIVVAGATTSATIRTSAAFAKNALEIGRLKFGGTVSTSSIISVGNIGKILAGSLSGSHIYAGVSSTISQSLALPATISDFAANAQIASVTLGSGSAAFSNTLISAETIGQLNLGNITSTNGGIPDGVAVHKLSRIIATLVPGGAINAGPAQLKSATTLTAYETAKKLALGDFEIKVI